MNETDSTPHHVSWASPLSDCYEQDTDHYWQSATPRLSENCSSSFYMFEVPDNKCPITAGWNRKVKKKRFFYSHKEGRGLYRLIRSTRPSSSQKPENFDRGCICPSSQPRELRIQLVGLTKPTFISLLKQRSLRPRPWGLVAGLRANW